VKTSANGRKFIEGFEGLILGAYDDHNDHVVPEGGSVVGTLTIGYGHTDAAGPPKVYIGQKITQAEADSILAADLASVEIEVNHLVSVPLTQNQFDALVSFQFNTGALGKSTLLKELNAKNYTGAADQFLLWNHAGGVVLAGLTRRREAEKEMFLTMAKPVVSGPVATTVAAGATATAVAVHSSPDHFWYIVGGVIILGVLIDLLVHYFNKGNTNVK
jgi:lysozyme